MPQTHIGCVGGATEAVVYFRKCRGGARGGAGGGSQPTSSQVYRFREQRFGVREPSVPHKPSAQRIERHRQVRVIRRQRPPAHRKRVAEQWFDLIGLPHGLKRDREIGHALGHERVIAGVNLPADLQRFSKQPDGIRKMFSRPSTSWLKLDG